jgi:prepilin-type N-terminal cleavage/methylation domain-containing protein
MKTILQDERGFNLVELMIATVVVVFVLVGFTGANTAIQQSGQAAFERAIALQDANQVIELIRDTAATGTFPTNVITAYSNGGVITSFTNLTNERITVSYVDATANPLNTTITVSWSENGRRTVNATLRSIITQRA